MRFWVGATDNDWFDYLSKYRPPVDEVNFWQPSGKPLFTSLPINSPFLFKLKAPHNCIAGGGFFVKGSALPMSVAWAAFETRNGTASRRELELRLRRLHDLSTSRDPSIYCNVLAEPFFWPREDWIQDPVGWAPSIVRGKTYDTAQADGAALWAQVELRLRGLPSMTGLAVAEPGPRYGAPALVERRLGQGAFRVLVADAYQRRCAITGENTLPTLEAAHIKPYAEDGPHDVRNGLLLRSDFHKLFDIGLVTVTPELVVEISPQIHHAYVNGKVYYRLHGHKLASLPEHPAQRPDPDFLRWHNENRFAA
jgi:putative restriction endonuclease